MSRDDGLWNRAVNVYLENEEQADELVGQALMTRREVARFLSVSVRTVQRMEARGTLTRVTVPGVVGARYRTREVEALIEPVETSRRLWSGDRPRWG